jgi:16S rRNA (uracil1498-N3)-methyltransferase
MRRFYAELPDHAEPVAGVRAVLDAEESRHLRTVLRLDDGDAIALVDGRGHLCTAVVREGGKHAVTVEITAVDVDASEDAAPRLHLGCAVVKGKHMEFAVEKAVELGAHRITPLRTARGVIDPREGKRDRWRNLLVAALKQSQRCRLPELHGPEDLDVVLAAAAAAGEVFFGAAPSDLVAERPQTLTSLAAQAQRRRLEGQQPPAELTLLVGPEGGWEPAELQVLAHAGAVPVWLGPHVLRTETAALAGLVALQQIRHAWRAGPLDRADGRS